MSWESGIERDYSCQKAMGLCRDEGGEPSINGASVECECNTHGGYATRVEERLTAHARQRIGTDDTLIRSHYRTLKMEDHGEGEASVGLGG